MPFTRPPGDPFRAIAESSPDAVICIDGSDTIVFWNASAETMFGHCAAQAMGKSLTDIIPAEYRQAHEGTRILGETLAMRALRSDGTVFPIELSLSEWNEGRGPFFTGIIRDVSERIAWTDLLRTSEQDHRRLFEYAHDAILLLDPDSEVVLAANRRAGELYGMNHADLIGLSMETFSIDVAGGRRRIFETLAGGGRHVFSTVQRRADGTVIELEIAAAITHYQGSDAILSINRDVTTQNMALRGLARERDFVSKVLEVAGSLVVVLDTEGRIVRFNRACEITSGYSAGEVVGQHVWRVLMFAEDQEEMRAELDRLRSGVGASTFENRLRTRDGLPRQISWASTSLYADSGDVEFIVSTGLDVTETRLIAEQLAKVRRLSSLGQLAATVAHEFNNVLMGILPFARVIAKPGIGDAQLATAATSIDRAVGRGRAIVQQILGFAQPADPVLARLLLDDFFTEFGEDMRPQLANRVTLSIDVPAGLAITGDPVQLHQVFSNLVLNARDAAQPGGKISIAAARGATGQAEFGVVRDPSVFVHFRVMDDGEGMSKETTLRLFEPLFTTKARGTGLGLAVSYQIVQRHSGHIFVESTPGQGATFHLYIPIAQNGAGS